jgi:predicted nucleic acid-binding protein
LSYLLDTNALSELFKKNPNPGLVGWLSQRPVESLYITVLTLEELHKGVQGIKDNLHRTKLLDWLETDLPIFFSGRTLTIDHFVADRWGKLMFTVGRPLPTIDSLLAATALHYGLDLVTRNTKDFDYLNLDVINPWA